MKLVIAEKNIAAQKIAQLLATGKPKNDKVYNTPVYRFDVEGEEWVSMGLAGHILAPEILFDKKEGWYSLTEDGEVLNAQVPDGLARPPYDTKRKPFLANGINIKGWKVESLPYLTWAPIIKNPAEKEIIRVLKNLAKKADSVVIATDFDREGELIGSDALSCVREVAPDVPVSRARYSALIKGEVTEAFNNLVELDQNLADAGESRQYIDLIWGAVLTRYLTLAKFGGFGNVRSAGRVQTPTLALVVERERERMAFVPEDYWQIRGMAAAKGADFKISHATARFTDKDAAQTAFGHVDGVVAGTVTDVAKRSRKQQPPVPFNTTSLQAAAAAEGISPARTMRIAESLYMSGLISYPRVDNTVYPRSLDLEGIVKGLAANSPALAPVCKKVLAGPMKPTRGKTETTDHPPIHPTGQGDPTTLDGGQLKLYNLIARRFLATLMGPATIENTKVSIDVAGEPFTASGDVLVDAGFREAYPYGLKRDEQLPALDAGDVVDVHDVNLEAKQTEPPARYSQGKLVQEMEKRGLGTKSTRASIIERLYQVRYLKNDPIEPSQLGMAIVDALSQFAPRITTPEMTAELDEDMTHVAEGQDTQTHVVDHSRALLAGMLDNLIEHKDDLGEAISDAVTADARVGTCPKCGKDLVMKQSAKTRGERSEQSLTATVGVSGRHVHLSQGDLEALFGAGYELTPIKNLSQPGQFASKETVTLVGPKGVIERVRVLGPVRSQTQVEILAGDSFKLGVPAMVRMSGKLEGTPGITLAGPKGAVTARHIHMSLAQAASMGLRDGQIVSIAFGGERGGRLDNVAIRANDSSELDCHIDTEEANALRISNGSVVRIIK